MKHRVRLCSGVCSTWLLDLSTYCQPVFRVSGGRHLRSADHGHLDFPRSDWHHMADVHLLTLVHQTGTHFPPTSETIVFLNFINATLRPVSSLSISTCSAFRALLQKKRYLNAPLLLLLLVKYLPTPTVVECGWSRVISAVC